MGVVIIGGDVLQYRMNNNSNGSDAEGGGAADDFIREIIAQDVRDGRVDALQVRFPPEPNGLLHVGHAKAIVLNFELAGEFGGTCNLRMDDTNPERENNDYIQAIIEDIRWLGYEWNGAVRYASDYFEQLYEFAVALIEAGKAYVDSSSPEDMRERRGTPTEPGRDSPHRGRSVEENLRLFAAMRAGEFADGACVLRAKIDMAHPNLLMRDPTLYRIRRQAHPRCGSTWVIYPLYDFAHGQSDAIEGITHSLCTLEFENHRPLYDWLLDALGFDPGKRPRQIEFARLNLSHTVLSKRLLGELVSQNIVSGWDDPRMPTLQGLRRRGVPAEVIRKFCTDIGITKVESVIDYAHFEYFLRDVLNACARRVMVVLDPLLVIIENYPEDGSEEITAINNPEISDGAGGVDGRSSNTRKIPFTKHLYIDRSDFMVDPPKKYFRLSPGAEVRLKHAYYITCTGVERNDDGTIQRVICKYDPESRGGGTPDGRRVRGTLQWVSKAHAVPLTIIRYDRLFTVDNVNEQLRNGQELGDLVNPGSAEVHSTALGEPELAHPRPDHYQFIRHGYYVHDPIESKQRGTLCYNRTVTLRDSWQKIAGKPIAAPAPASAPPPPVR